MTNEELKHDISLARQEANTISATAVSEGRGLTPGEKARCNVLVGTIEHLTTKMKAARDLERNEGTPAYDSERGYHATVKDAKGTFGVVGKPKYAQLFGQPEKSQFKSAEEFFSIVATGRYDPRLKRVSLGATSGEYGMNETVESEGGWAVPTEFRPSFWIMRCSREKLFARARASSR
jgi:hypothetical protein